MHGQLLRSLPACQPTKPYKTPPISACLQFSPSTRLAGGATGVAALAAEMDIGMNLVLVRTGSCAAVLLFLVF